MTEHDTLKKILSEIEYAPVSGKKPYIKLANQFSNNALDNIVDAMIMNGIKVVPCREGDTVYKIIKCCENNTGFKEFYKPSVEFKEDCPYFEPQSWYDDCDRCLIVQKLDNVDVNDGDCCDLHLDIFCDDCKNRLAIQKEVFKLSMCYQIYGTPMFKEDTPLEYTYFLSYGEAENKIKELKLQKVKEERKK